jgi:predicted membrane-bound spermidine synthase
MAGQSETAQVPWWRVMLIAAVAIVAASGAALLLIPQLSLPATIRGGSIAMGSIIVSRLIVSVYERSRRRRAGE